MAKRNLSFQRILWGIAGIFLSGLVVTLFVLHTIQQYTQVKERAAAMRTAFVARQKQVIRREVDRIVDHIQIERSRIIPEAGDLVKAGVYETFAMIENIQKAEAGTLAGRQIRKIIVNALGPMRIASGKGDLFILNLNGRTILGDRERHPRSADLIKLVEEKGEGISRHFRPPTPQMGVTACSSPTPNCSPPGGGLSGQP